VRDKEASVRQHAVVALSKLQDADEGADEDEEEENSDEEDDSEDETPKKGAKGSKEEKKKSVTEVLIEALSFDAAAFVFSFFFTLIASISHPSPPQRSPPRRPFQPHPLPSNAPSSPPPHPRRRHNQPPSLFLPRPPRDPRLAPHASTTKRRSRPRVEGSGGEREEGGEEIGREVGGTG
jgi:hypothetical protein